MLLGLATAAIVLSVLVCELAGPKLRAELGRAAMRARQRILFLQPQRVPELDYDPGRERRAELRAVALLRSCVNEEEWAMYRDLGFLRVWGQSGARVDTTAAKVRPAAEVERGQEAKPQLGAETERSATIAMRCFPIIRTGHGNRPGRQTREKLLICHSPESGWRVSAFSKLLKSIFGG